MEMKAKKHKLRKAGLSLKFQSELKARQDMAQGKVRSSVLRVFPHSAMVCHCHYIKPDTSSSQDTVYNLQLSRRS